MNSGLTEAQLIDFISILKVSAGSNVSENAQKVLTRDLMDKLPVTVTLNRGPIDYCGGIAPIRYEDTDVQTGYQTGDLAFCPPGQDFVIFTEKNDTASEVPGLVIIGRIDTDIEAVRNLGSAIRVTIDLKK